MQIQWFGIPRPLSPPRLNSRFAAWCARLPRRNLQLTPCSLLGASSDNCGQAVVCPLNICLGQTPPPVFAEEPEVCDGVGCVK